MTIIIETPDTRAPERDYILGVVLGDFLGLGWQRVPSGRTDTRITLQGHSGEIRMPDILFRTPDQDWLTSRSLPYHPLQIWDTAELGLPITLVDQDLPVIYGDPQPGRRTQTPGPASEVSTINYSPLTHNYSQLTHHIPIDIFGSAFFMLTRYEEIVKSDRDEHDRFPAWAALSYQENFLERPIVDEYVEVLWAVIHGLWPGLKRKTTEYRLVLTHDVDRPFGVKGEPWLRVFRRFGGDILVRKSVWLAGRRAGSVLLPGEAGEELDPNNTFDWIMEQSERCGLQSEFYFMATKAGDHDSGYDIFSPRILRLLRQIHERGHMIGLHPSYDTLGNPPLLTQEADKLRTAMEKAGVQQDLKGGRQHYLRWWANRTWTDWETARLAFDSSAGFAHCVGFRAGTCREYSTWSWRDNRPLKFSERPLIVMDGTLFAEKYMNLSSGSAMQKLKLLGDRIKRFHGNFVVLWHNDSLLDLKDFYENALSKMA